MTRSQHSSGWVGSTPCKCTKLFCNSGSPSNCWWTSDNVVTGGLPPQGSLKKTLQSGPWASMGHSGVFVAFRCGFGHIYPGGEPVIQSLTVNEDIDLKLVICSESALREVLHPHEPRHSQTPFFWPDLSSFCWCLFGTVSNAVALHPELKKAQDIQAKTMKELDGHGCMSVAQAQYIVRSNQCSL